MSLATLETGTSSRKDVQSMATGNRADTFYLQSWILGDFACYEFVWAKSGLDLTIFVTRARLLWNLGAESNESCVINYLFGCYNSDCRHGDSGSPRRVGRFIVRLILKM